MFEKILDWQAGQNPDRAAIASETGEITYRRLATNVSQMTTALALENLPSGVVLVGGLKPALTWLLVFALERLGHATAIASSQIDDDVAIVRPAVVITREREWKKLTGVRILHFSEAWLDQALKQPPTARRSPAGGDDVVRVVLSSGTTGVRKRVPITRRIIDARIGRPLIASAASEPRFLQSQGMDTIGAFRHPLTIWSHGGVLITPAHLSSETFRTFRPNLMAMSPISLRNALPLMKSAFSASDRVHIWAIGSALPPPLIGEAMACEGVDVSLVYSSTEGGNIASGPASLAIDRPGAVGFPAPWVELEIVDDRGNVIGPGQSGLIRVRGEGVIDGRLAKEPNAECDDDWFYPNDLGHIEPDGVLVIDGRLDDVINIGGVKLSSTRVEETILTCAGVNDVAVTVLPMASGRWALFAAIVSPDGYSVEDVRQTVQRVHKVDPTLVDLPEIARNAMGKIRRAAVRDAILSRLGVKSN